MIFISTVFPLENTIFKCCWSKLIIVFALIIVDVVQLFFTFPSFDAQFFHLLIRNSQKNWYVKILTHSSMNAPFRIVRFKCELYARIQLKVLTIQLFYSFEKKNFSANSRESIWSRPVSVVFCKPKLRNKRNNLKYPDRITQKLLSYPVFQSIF